MKKLLAVAGLGLVGVYVAKKVIDRKRENKVVEEHAEEVQNEEVVENVEEEVKEDDRILQYLGPDEYIVADEEIEVEIVDAEYVENKNVAKEMVKRVIDVPIKVNGFICDKIIRINRKLESMGDYIQPVKYKPGIMNAVCFYSQIGLLYAFAGVEVFNRCILLALGLISVGLNKLKK